MWSAADARLHYALMRLARDLDARFESLLLTGRVSKWYSQVGNEGTTVAAGLALGRGDTLVSLHRDLGAILAVYLDPDRTFPDCDFVSQEHKPDPLDLLYRLACQLLGRDDGFSRGVERSFHYQYRDDEAGIDHLGMISHLGSMIPVAAGAAFAHRQRGRDRVAINFIGDGGTSTGDFHEGLNMAAVWKLPLVLVIENNGYAFSTPTSAQYACDRLSDRAAGYGIPGVTVYGNDPEAVSRVMVDAVARARRGEGPTLIEATLGRMKGHSEGDDSLKMVPEEDLARFQRDDPVQAMRRRLLDSGSAEEEFVDRLEARVGELVEECLGRALEADPPSPARAFQEVFEPLRETSRGGALRPSRGGPGTSGDAQPTSYVDAIAQALCLELERDPDLVLMGQDIGAFEGAFRVTRGFHERWPERVLDTPIAESGAIGIASGAALDGIPVVVEMQFADFISCGFNQLVNVAAKFYYRWQRPCPIVVRLPSGGGVGAGPFHSQNPEGWFVHTAGLKVVCPATAVDARDLLIAAIRDPNPVLFLEHKYLYRRIKEVLLPRSTEDAVEELGRSRVARQGNAITLVGYGSSTWWCLEAAEQLASDGVEAEVIDLRTLVPLDEEKVLASVRKTGRVVIAHEAQLTGGFGAEIAARIADQAFAHLDAPVQRVAYPDRPVPYAKSLERELLPGTDRVIEMVRSVLSW